MSFVVVLCDMGEQSRWRRDHGGAYLPFASAHTSICGMGTSRRSLTWACGSSLRSFVVVLHEVGEWSRALAIVC